MRTFLDSGALIAAFRGDSEAGRRALLLLDDADRQFVTSDFVRLEILPRAIFHKRPEEVAFYETILKSTVSVPVTKSLLDRALKEASAHGLSAVDALHVAAAKSKRCRELYTTERSEKPIFRVKGITVRSLL